MVEKDDELICECEGTGMYYDDERRAVVVCKCPAGFRRGEYLRMTHDERQKAIKEHEKQRNEKDEEDPVPF